MHMLSHACMHTLTDMYSHTCTYAHMHAWIHSQTCIHIHVHALTYMHMLSHTCTCTHKYTNFIKHVSNSWLHVGGFHTFPLLDPEVWKLVHTRLNQVEAERKERLLKPQEVWAGEVWWGTNLSRFTSKNKVRASWNEPVKDGKIGPDLPP